MHVGYRVLTGKATTWAILDCGKPAVYRPRGRSRFWSQMDEKFKEEKAPFPVVVLSGKSGAENKRSGSDAKAIPPFPRLASANYFGEEHQFRRALLCNNP